MPICDCKMFYCFGRYDRHILSKEHLRRMELMENE